jgi:hypothetical protein
MVEFSTPTSIADQDLRKYPPFDAAPRKNPSETAKLPLQESAGLTFRVQGQQWRRPDEFSHRLGLKSKAAQPLPYSQGG